MKTITTVLVLIFLALGSLEGQAQLLKRVKERVKDAVEETTARKAEQKTEQAVDSVLEKPFKLLKKKNKKKVDSEESSTDQNGEMVETNDSSDDAISSDPEEGGESTHPILWSTYNFVPGDKILFFDNLEGEESGEFPSRWDLLRGSAQNARLGEENVIQLDNKSIIAPLTDAKAHLPEVFTIEFDAYFPGGDTYSSLNYYGVRLWPEINSHKTESGDSFKPIYLYNNGLKFTRYMDGQARVSEVRKAELKENYGWKHVAIAFNKRSLKIYLNETQVLNLPNLGMRPKQFNIESYLYHDKTGVIKNVRIAEGGKKLYERVISEGKFVTRGILFAVNRADIQLESAGVLNEVAQMMKSHTDLSFRIEGHTDSDGEEAYNLSLSAKRAEAVKSALARLGISEDRLQTEGKGESTPVADNQSPEGKANNRRVEFIKL
ncbi:MAG: OmpA family protein [Bacteroidota bacterium]